MASDVCTLRLTLDDFDLEDSTDCFNDYLLLPDGQKLCGALPPDTSKTVSISRRHSSFTFIFSSNEAKTARGFMIRVEQVRDSCSDDLPDSPLFPTDSQTDDFLPVGRPQPQFAGGLCDQRLAAATSVVRSPGYPGGYGPNLRCRYTVLKLNRNVCRVQVLFKRFSLENSFGCRKDYLEMPDRTRICGRYAGSRTYDFNRDTVNLYFTTDGFQTDSGFEIEVRQLLNSCLYPGTSCKWTLFGSKNNTIYMRV